jgi:hypothetical protein
MRAIVPTDLIACHLANGFNTILQWLNGLNLIAALILLRARKLEQGRLGIMAIFVTESQVTELLDMPTAIQAVEEVMKLHGEGKAVNHPRQRVRRQGVILHWMAATVPEWGMTGFKVYTPRSVLFFLYGAEGELLMVAEAGETGANPNRRCFGSGNQVYGSHLTLKSSESSELAFRLKPNFQPSVKSDQLRKFSLTAGRLNEGKSSLRK